MLAEATATAGRWLLNKAKDPIKATTHGHSYIRPMEKSAKPVIAV